MFVVRLAAEGWEFDTVDELTLLEAASLSGIILPSSCRNGTCRTCLCHLDSGEVAHQIEWPGLSAEEKQAGFILPCVACARSDLVLSAVAARRLTPS